MKEFEEKLEGLKTKDPYWSDKAKEEAEKVVKKEFLEKHRSSIDNISDSADKIRPLLELVNTAYLGDRGKILCGKPELDYGRIRALEKSGKQLEALLTLDWYAGKGKEGRLSVFVRENEIIIEGGAPSGGGATVEVNTSLQEECWEEQVEEGIYTILTTPGGYTYRRAPADVDRIHDRHR